MTASQRYGRFAVPFRIPLLFSLRKAWVTAAETSSRRENGVHAWALLTCGISWSPADSCLDCMAREVKLPTRMYLANRSQPYPGAGVHFRAKWVAHPWASQVGFCAFLCTIFASSHNDTLLSHCHTVTLVPRGTLSLSCWFLGDHKQKSSFAWPWIALVEIFWGTERLDFSTRLTAISTPVQSLEPTFRQ